MHPSCRTAAVGRRAAEPGQATLALAFASYRGAAAVASAYGRSLETTFDPHRFDLLAALGVPRPCSPAAERTANEQITTFLVAGGEWPLPYDPAGRPG